MTVADKRKYVLSRIAAGDYIFLSNDAKTLWRVYRYEEDGSLVDGDQPVTGQFWAAARFDGTVAAAERLMKQDPDEFIGWTSWEHWASPLRTREEAIEEALRV